MDRIAAELSQEREARDALLSDRSMTAGDHDAMTSAVAEREAEAEALRALFDAERML